MNAGDLLSMSWGNLTRQKGRTALTAAGVIVGVATLVLMISLGLGLQLEVLKLFESEDELRTLHVSRPGNEREHAGSFNLFAMLGAQVLPITEKDLSEIGALPGVERARPELDIALRFKVDTSAGSRTIPFGPVGAAHPEEEARYRSALVEGQGRMWASTEERACILPRQFLEFRLHLKPEDVLGRKLTFGSAPDEGEAPPETLVYTCVGVFDAEKTGIKGRKIVLAAARMMEVREATRGGLFYPIPFKTGTYPSASVRLSVTGASEGVAARLKGLGFDVVSTSDIIKSVNIIFLIVEGVMGCIGAIGLVVSLFGIANTMTMAVLERTREIGIMKALGARNRDIARLFLAEAAAIGAAGGAIGLTAAFLVGKALNLLARGALNLPAGVSLFHVSAWLAAGSVVFSMLVSMLAGTLPARRAARMDPVRSLRYE